MMPNHPIQICPSFHGQPAIRSLDVTDPTRTVVFPMSLSRAASTTIEDVVIRLTFTAFTDPRHLEPGASERLGGGFHGQRAIRGPRPDKRLALCEHQAFTDLGMRSTSCGRGRSSCFHGPRAIRRPQPQGPPDLGPVIMRFHGQRAIRGPRLREAAIWLQRRLAFTDSGQYASLDGGGSVGRQWATRAFTDSERYAGLGLVAERWVERHIEELSRTAGDTHANIC